MSQTNSNHQDTEPFRYQEPVSIGAQLHRHLRGAIIRGELKPGHALSETEVSKQYSVSRQPVREAFIKLAEEHLVEVLPQRGTFVVKISINDVMDAQFMRETIEVAIVREVAAAADPEVIKRLRHIVQQQAQLPAGDNKGFLALDEAFHRTIAQAANRDRVWRVLEAIKSQMDRVRYLSVDDATPTELLVQQHEAIVDAIEKGNPEMAIIAMQSHLREILNSLPEIAAHHPDIFEKSTLPNIEKIS